MSATHGSNATGTVTPVQELVQIVIVLRCVSPSTGAQSISHIPTNVTALDADFFVFSGHKIFDPPGSASSMASRRCWKRRARIAGRGNMIADDLELTRYQPSPNKFEAGTTQYCRCCRAGAAIDYVTSLGIENIAQYGACLTGKGLRVVGYSGPDVGRYRGEQNQRLVFCCWRGMKMKPWALSQSGWHRCIAVRASLCATDPARRLGYESTVQPSLAFTTRRRKLDFLAEQVARCRAAMTP